VTLPAHQLTPLLDLALRAAGTHSALTIKRLQRKAGEVQVQLTGDEIRMILDLALCAKLKENNTDAFKIVPWPKKSYRKLRCI
jgi:hypothetical protein